MGWLPSTAARWALAACGLLVGVYAVFVLTVPGQRLDDELFGLAQRVAPHPINDVMPVIGRRLLPALLLLGLLVVDAWALVQRRWGDVVRGVLVILLAVPSSRLLREALPRPDHGYSYDVNTMPSTHVTLVAATAAAIIIACRGRRLEWLLPVLAGAVTLAAAGNVIGHSHRPIDTVASVCLVSMWAGLVRWATFSSGRGRSGDRPRARVS